jgi:hypothetical protein
MADTPVVTSPVPPPVVAPKYPPTITSKNLPPELPKPGAVAAPVAPTIADDADIVARPLVSPDFTNLKPTNPAMILRLVNRLALDGQRFKEACIQGYVVCKVTDIKDCPSTMTVKDGNVTYGDVIVMMMARDKYLGAIKNNEQNARARTARAVAMGEGQKHLAEALNEVPGSRADKSKIKLFQPDR